MNSILFSESPIAHFTAEVLTENDCSYFYLYRMDADREKIVTMAACWIKNHVFVDDSYSSADDMDKGKQPKVNTKYCRYPEDLSLLVAEDLEIVWGKEGCLAGLFCREELICAIPYWADSSFSGYSKYSDTETMGLYPLPLQPGNAMFPRLQESRRFWAQDFSQVWSRYQKDFLEELENQFGKAAAYYAIDGGQFPPKGLAVFQTEKYRYAFTIGVGMFPQPSVELHREDYENYDKIELGFCWKQDLPLEETKVLSQMSSIVTMPWMHAAFFSHHHTIDFNSDPAHPYAVFLSDREAGQLNSSFLRRNQVDLLWLMPLGEESYHKLATESPDYSEVDQRMAKQGIRLESLER